jgi:hypothetical protein
MKKLGRPKTATKQTARTRIAVTLNASEKARLKKIGGGSVSLGIRMALEFWEGIAPPKD